MKSTIISALVELMAVFLKFLSVDRIREFADWLLDKVEDHIADSKTQIDDKLLLPLITQLREALNIPDNDEAATPQVSGRESQSDDDAVPVTA